MNDSVLRGFCNESWQPIYYELSEQKWVHSFGIPCGKVYCLHPEPFLSSEQMKFLQKRDWSSLSILIVDLKNNPFSLAKILSEAKSK